MLNWQKTKWLKVVAIATVLAFMPVQASWAGRGRRGGNSSTEVIVAAIGGAALPLTVYFAGADMNIVAGGMLVGSVTSAFMAKAGCDPQVTALVSAGASGVASAGIATGSFQLSNTMVHSVVKRLVAAEVSYELAQSGYGPLVSGVGGALAGQVVGGGAISLAEGKFGEFASALGNKDSPLRENITRTLISRGVNGLIHEGIKSIVGERSLSLIYAGNISSLGGDLAEGFAEEIGFAGLQKPTYYGVAGTVGSKHFEQSGVSKEGDPASETEIAKSKEHGGAGYYDEENKEVVIVRKNKSGQYRTFRYKVTGGEEASYIANMAKRGYGFMVGVNPKTKEAEVRVVYEYKRKSFFAGSDIDGKRLWGNSEAMLNERLNQLSIEERERFIDVSQSQRVPKASERYNVVGGQLELAVPQDKIRDFGMRTFEIDLRDVQPTNIGSE